MNRIRARLDAIVPRSVYLFDRPLLLLQSDDWGRIGLRDEEGFAELSAGGTHLGEQPYDFYTLETAEDLSELRMVFARHRDAVGRTPVLEMNFITANLDFGKTLQDAPNLHFIPLADGLPDAWSRPGLLNAYRDGVDAEFFYPALHGTSHFCRKAVQRNFADNGERGKLLRTLWEARTPYIYWRMPWIGYEYWDPEQAADSRFLRKAAQEEYVGQGVALFAKLFSTMARSACAPGYRANPDTSSVYALFGIRCAQNGPSHQRAPHFDGNEILQIYRTVEFEPAVNADFSLEGAIRQAEECFAIGVPATVSVHSINFHSTVRDFRTRTLTLLDDFLETLESRHPDLLYVHDDDLWQIIQSGSYECGARRTTVNVTKRRLRNSGELRSEDR